MVEVMRPEPGMTIYDPACGTGGFLLAVHDYISKNYPLDKEQKRFLKFNTLSGKDIVDGVARLCVMNLYLHGIGGEDSPIEVGDSLISDPGTRYDMILTNPPFGKKSSITIVNGEGKADRESLVYERQDFWATTSNKQLNFLQHVKTLLKINGRAGIVVPDNVLFEGGAGETVRRKLLAECDVHTLLRLRPRPARGYGGYKADAFPDKVTYSQRSQAEYNDVYVRLINSANVYGCFLFEFKDYKSNRAASAALTEGGWIKGKPVIIEGTRFESGPSYKQRREAFYAYEVWAPRNE
jgi:hypothetical protein